MRIIAAALIFLISTNGHAADFGKALVRVEHFGSDSIGKQIAYKLREEIAKSALMGLKGDDDQVYLLAIWIASLDSDGGDAISNNVSAFSVTWTIHRFDSGDDVFMGSSVQITGENKIGATVSDLAAETYEHVVKARTQQREWFDEMMERDKKSAAKK
jgi:hypothetical protein